MTLIKADSRTVTNHY